MAAERLLELRIHGVNNTPPAAILDAVQRECGDADVGFYRQRPNPGLVRAFSWGGAARTSPTGNWLNFSSWLRAVSNAGWLLIIPFGLTNVAYWSRRLVGPGQRYRSARGTAALTRLFGLGQTLLLAATFSTVGLALAPQRIAADDPGNRTAVLSLVPFLAILALAVTEQILNRSERPATALPDRPAEAAASQTPDPRAVGDRFKLGCRNFWAITAGPRQAARVHTAAGWALTLIWTGQTWRPEHPAGYWLSVGVAAALLTACVTLTAVMPLVSEGPAKLQHWRRGAVTAVWWASLAAFGAQLAALLVVPLRPTTLGLAGLSMVPGALVFVMFVIAVSALGWRAHRRASYLLTALLLATGGLAVLADQLAPAAIGARAGLAATVLVALALAVWCLRLLASPQPAEAWRGAAPGVLLLLALTAAMLLSTVFVLLSADLLADGRIGNPGGQIDAVPPIYLSFAAILPVSFLVLAATAAVVIGRVRRCAQLVEPDLDATTQPPTGEPQDRARRTAARRRAALAHRAEPAAGVLAAVAAATLLAGLVLAALVDDAGRAESAVLRPLTTVGVGAAILLGVTLLGLGTNQGRPLGVVWDLICFLPRAAHPFGPPCYAQQVVPTLLAYCRAWLGPARPAPATGNCLVLAAHSLGGVLAVAVLLQLDQDYRGRIGLLSYGSQLRAYFGRIFPELLGPNVLGVHDAGSARLLRCPTFDDPPSRPAPAEAPATVAELLSSADRLRWVNLWRPTDHLGFPVFDRRPDNGVDVPADELITETAETRPRVDTHGDYPRAPQYQQAMDRLRAQLSN